MEGEGLCKVKAFPLPAPSPMGTPPFYLVIWLPPYLRYMPPPSRSPPCFLLAKTLLFPWPGSVSDLGSTLHEDRLVSNLSSPVSLGPKSEPGLQWVCYVFSHCLQGKVGSDWPQRADDGAGQPHSSSSAQKGAGPQESGGVLLLTFTPPAPPSQPLHLAANHTLPPSLPHFPLRSEGVGHR